jgi:hypothetical protein
MRLWCSGLILIATLALSQTTPPTVVPRTILVTYDGTYGNEIKFLPTHAIAEMPLNQLGLVVQYWDIRQGLPGPNQLKDVRGILTWFRADAMADPLGYLKWCEDVVDSGKRFVIIGDLAVTHDFKNRLTPLSAMNRLWSRFGLQSTDNWVGITYDWKVVFKDSSMVEFERKLPRNLPEFIGIKAVDSSVKSYLTVRHGDDPATDVPLVAVTKNGGYISANYVQYSTSETHNRVLYANLFEFFREAFATDDLPKADITTLTGRRIFYSHIDGDGWRNVSEVAPYRKDRKLSPYVVMKEVVERFPDLPITIAPIAADLDPAWRGNAETMQVARELFAHKNVEPSSHTYAHPLEWSAFANEATTPVREAQGRQKPTIVDQLFNLGREPEQNKKTSAKSRYEQPVSYLDQPFDLNREIRGSVDFINRLAPAGKRVRLIQWSGNALPFERAIELSRQAGLRNINGGDTRKDPEYPSYGWVSPVGLQAGKQRQIYTSASNENTYTNLWTSRYFGYRFLTQTVQNTESPIRIKPFNIYFHMYSGEKLASLLAVVDNFKYAMTQELTPVETSRYAAIADGFYSTRLVSLSPGTWRIENRDGLQTIRFDRATLQAVDFEHSSGVLGQRRFQGSLYVALDPGNTDPVVALKQSKSIEDLPASKVPYLVNSRWEIASLQRQGEAFSFESWGFGPGEATWYVPASGDYSVRIRRNKGTVTESVATTQPDHLLKLKFGPSGTDKIQVEVAPVGTTPR